ECDRQDRSERDRSHDVYREKDGQHDESERVVCDREQQQKWNRRMTTAKQPTGQQEAERDVRGGGNRPTSLELWEPCRCDQTKVDGGRCDHSTNSGKYRRGRF